MRFHGTAEWRRLRRTVLERDHWLCRLCGRPASVADYITSLRNGGTQRLGEPAALCVRCDNALKEDHTGKRRSGGMIRGCDATGMPLDRGHWWSAK